MPKLLVTGDSITAASYVTEEQTYGKKIKDYLGFTSYINTAVPGWTSQDMAQNVQSKILNHAPSHVIIMLGTNDIAQGCVNGTANTVVVNSYIANMSYIIEKCKSQNIKINVMSHPISKNYYEYERGRKMVESLNLLCIQKGVTFIDIFNYFSDKSTRGTPEVINGMFQLYPDRHHLNAAGHEFIYFILTKNQSKLL